MAPSNHAPGTLLRPPLLVLLFALLLALLMVIPLSGALVHTTGSAAFPREALQALEAHHGTSSVASPFAGRPLAASPYGVPPPNIKVSNVEPEPAGEPTFAVNRYGVLFANWEEQGVLQNPVGPAGYAISNDDGQTFGTNVIDQVPGSQFEYDVTSSADSPNGTMYWGFGVYPGTTCGGGFTSDDYLVALWDNGTHASEPMRDIPCAVAGTGQFLDRDWLGSTPNGTEFHVVDDGNGNVWLNTLWGGTHLGAPRIIYNQGANGIPMNAFAYNNSLWAVADAGTSSGAGGCFVTVSRNTGATWTPGTSPAGCSASTGISWYATWGQGATIDLDYVDASGLEFVQSSDLGQTWSAPTLLSGTVPGGTSFLTPTIGADPTTGELEAVWLDTRTNPGSYYWVVYETDSPDNGLTWGPVRQLSTSTVGYGASFWPGDYIWSAITPWGTAGAIWGDNRSQTILSTYFAQVPLLNAADGNLTVDVVNPSGGAIANALVDVGSLPSRTSAAGNVTYFALGPATYPVTASDPTWGSGSASATVTRGTTTAITIMLGSTGLLATASATPVTGAPPLGVTFNGTATGGTPPYSFAWRFGDGGSSVLRDPTHTYASVGSYTAWLWVNDSAGHAASSNVAISVRPGPFAVSGSVTPKQGPAPLTVQLLLNASGGSAPYAYAVRFGDGGTSVLASPTHTYASPGVYTLHAWVNDSSSPVQGAQWSGTVTVTNPLPLTVSLSGAPTLGPGPLNVTYQVHPAGGTASYTSFTFTFGDGTTASSGGPSSTITHVYAAPGFYNATVQLTDSSGATAASSPVQIEVLRALTVALTSNPVSPVSGGSSVAFTASPHGGSYDYVGFRWSFGNGVYTQTTVPTSSATFGAQGTYTVNVTVTDSDGNTATTSLVVQVQPTGTNSGSTGGGLRVMGVDLLLLVVVLAVVAAAAILFVWVYRRGWRGAPPGPGSVAYDLPYNSPLPEGAAPSSPTWAPSEPGGGGGPPPT